MNGVFSVGGHTGVKTALRSLELLLVSVVLPVSLKTVAAVERDRDGSPQAESDVETLRDGVTEHYPVTEGGEGMGGRVLIIEDEPNIIEAIRFILSRDGWSVDTHSDGATAFATVKILDILIVGQTESRDLPVTRDALQRRFAGGKSDGWLAILSPDGSIWATIPSRPPTAGCESAT